MSQVIRSALKTFLACLRRPGIRGRTGPPRPNSVSGVLPPTRPPPSSSPFGATAGPGYTHVDPAARYSPSTSFGFENFGGAFPTSVPAHSDDPLYSGWVTADAPVFFSANVPEGNYRVAITFDGDSTTTVKAELRRLMLEQIQNHAGSHTTRTFAVNVHKPPILDATGKEISRVKIKAREVTRGGPWNGLNRTQGGEGFSWDDALTLEFSGKPAVSAVEITRDDSIHTVYICGDSTVCDQPAEPFTSWGQMITRWFKPDFAVVNLAISGETAAAFYGENRMAKIISQLRPRRLCLCAVRPQRYEDQRRQSSGVIQTTLHPDRHRYARQRSNAGIAHAREPRDIRRRWKKHQFVPHGQRETIIPTPCAKSPRSKMLH